MKSWQNSQLGIPRTRKSIRHCQANSGYISVFVVVSVYTYHMVCIYVYILCVCPLAVLVYHYKYTIAEEMYTKS